ncbi:hypothetical protein [Pseudomonas fluorescens]|uniref:Uncharacterized protein n=1 Tax=Pseudomonas fluorescens TaxID=294 RepID=A0A5E7E4Z1_PSEFL|nr:hypothetical protein [Pseudomonas fluorescens]VVO21727.1 hypothetical protein PS723_04263 [Pseudomonas fluorescens]
MNNNEMVSVPRELTDEMAEAIGSRAAVCGGGAFEIWEAVIAAAPAAEHQPQQAAVLPELKKPYYVVRPTTFGEQAGFFQVHPGNVVYSSEDEAQKSADLYNSQRAHKFFNALKKAAPLQHQSEPSAYVLHKNGIIDWDQEVIISNTGGDESDERFKWVAVYTERPAHYTAIDMTTAAADGFRGGQTVVPELTNELREILGMMCFQCITYAQALRQMGHTIAKKAEDEQAVTIHWMLGHYLRDAANWRQNAIDELKTDQELAQVGCEKSADTLRKLSALASTTN